MSLFLCCLLFSVTFVKSSTNGNHQPVNNHKQHLKSLHGISLIHSIQGKIDGVLYFDQVYAQNSPVRITGKIQGLKPGAHGVHIHSWGNLTKKCDSIGPHFNPDWMRHGGPSNNIRHVGDLGNQKGVNVNFTDFQVSLFGRNSIFGRAVAIHENVDDFGKGDSAYSSSSGNSGIKIACGIIGKRDIVYG